MSERVNSESIVVALEEALGKIKNINPLDLHQQVAQMYRWDEVASRTVLVYDGLRTREKPILIRRILNYLRIGRFFGLLGVLLVSIDCIFLFILNYFTPANEIEVAKEIKFRDYKKYIRTNHINLHNRCNTKKKEAASVGFNKE